MTLIRMSILSAALVTLVTAVGAWADDVPEVPLSSTATADCYATAEGDDARRLCIGKSTNECMDAPGGSTTIGIGACLQDEAGWWDRLLNTTYKDAMGRAATSDAMMKEDGIDVPSQAEALRTMQRSWIAFRDDKCAYVASLWTNGTGASTAFVDCLLRTTAEQAIFLGSDPF
ncbi:lysozyme inhibitor LprI family protein [Chachezhania sediminis]|uniref:lysozyme inhibitor LprI family protein n=1 Tax=Chachezhania sediminis TaxID=2599291 RepID=UPI00131B54E1|nr:lysozyme inhibitor LprI family protein [Chachezhania sediminis]